MQLIRTCTVLLSLSAGIAAFGQSAPPPAASSGTASGPVDLSGFKQSIEQKNKALNDQVSNEKAIVRKNSLIIEDAKRIDAENKKLQAARKLLDAQNAEFEREREAIQAEQTQMGTQTPQPQPPPAAVRPAPAPVRQIPAAASVASRSQAPIPAPRPIPALLSDADDPVPVDGGLKTASISTGPLTSPVATNSDGVIVVTSKSDSPLRVSAGVLQGMLLSPIRPVYPQMARTAHVEGSVVLDAVISKRGTVENVQAVSGPMILREAAIEAIQSAKYQPYRVNEEPIEVETTITIAFEQVH